MNTSGHTEHTWIIASRRRKDLRFSPVQMTSGVVKHALINEREFPSISDAILFSPGIVGIFY